MSELVDLTPDQDVAVITIQNPPVNALRPGVPEGMAAALEAAERDPSIRPIVIIGEGRTFLAGADIRELEHAAQGHGAPPKLHGLLAQIEDCSKPVVMAIHGTALGGGLEVAMAGHYRIATADAQLGQPEVNLGIIPGAESTQRLPRPVGIASAIKMCVSGKPVAAAEALRLGLIDAMIDGDFHSGAIAFAREKALRKGPHPKTRHRQEKLGSRAANAPLLAGGRVQARQSRRNMAAPLAAIDELKGAESSPFDEGCKREREIVTDCLASDQCRALMDAFFAERAAAKIPDLPSDTPVWDIRSAAIVGAGTMGSAIAMALANSGISVRLKDLESAELDRGIAWIRQTYAASVKKGRFSQEVMDQRTALIHPQLSHDGLDTADLVIEAVFENLALKKQIFAGFDRVAKPECILASNTSTLDIDQMAAATGRLHNVLGLHFFSPAHVMRLVEIVRGKDTSKSVIATAMALAKKLRKVGVVVGNCWGFVGNRMMLPYMREAQFPVEEGATPAEVHQALCDWGMAMGIFAVDDMGGLDVQWHVRQERKPFERPGLRQPLVLEQLYQMGRLGQKAGAGWYRYDENPMPAPDPEMLALIEKTARENGIPRRTITTDEILERSISIMINEGARILEEDYALRAADIDTIYLTGYGFPPYRGGPMWCADTVGLKKVYRRVEEFHAPHGEHWAPSPLLKHLAEEGSTFAAFDATKESLVRS